MKNKILLFIKIPPPVTGATLMNTYVRQSKILRRSFDMDEILISYAKDVNELGKWRLKKILIIIQTILSLVKKLIIKKPNLIYFQISPLGFAFLRDLLYVSIIKIFRVKIVFHLHGKGIDRASKNIFLLYLYKWAFHANEIICLSNLLTSDFNNVFRGKPYIVPNGIPYSNIDSSSTSVDRTIKLLFLSNLIISKGIFDFVEALSILKYNKVLFQASIVGKEGDLTSDQLNSLLIQKKLDSITKYLGPKYNSDKQEILRKADILVFPTYYKNETFGLVNLEAMQFAIPIISTKEGAIPEIIDDGITGYLVEKNNPQQIAEKIEILAEDPELRKRMGESGRRKYLEKYTLEKFEQNLNGVFKDILYQNATK